MVWQGFVSRNASRNTRVQGEVLLVPLISCSNVFTSADNVCESEFRTASDERARPGNDASTIYTLFHKCLHTGYFRSV